MQARVRLRAKDNSEVVLGHGDLIGRVWSARLNLDDPRVSEAHAMVSLRGDQLVLLGLRGRFRVGGNVLTEAPLARGQTIDFTPDHTYRVVAVEIPDVCLALSAPGFGPVVLSGTCAVMTDPPALASAGQAGAVAHVFRGAEGWRIQPTDGVSVPLQHGDVHELGGVAFKAVNHTVNAIDRATVSAGGLETPLHVVANFQSVHIHRPGYEPFVISGLGARILSELVAFGGPVPWRVLASELWGSEIDERSLRKRLDVAMVLLRRRLVDARIRGDLVRADGRGMYELVLESRDRVEDRT